MQRIESNKEILGLNRITKKRILELCRKDKLYQTPELNDVLYLHYQGFDCIECLEDYTELKCLWLDCNAISEIQGLDKQNKLKCLFLQSNLIRKIENLEYCKELDTLNLSQNHIKKIENCGFEVLPVLNTLNLASNYLKDCEGLKELEYCKNLSVLDLSNNRIDDILVVKIFSHMPELKVLVLQGNPVVSKIPQYRKTLVLECKKLTYLDSRPVFPKDRACAEAWKRGGYKEERKENERWNRKERKKMRDSVNATIHLRNKNRQLADHIALIPSSDSEDDTKEQKRNIRILEDSEASMDSVWDEVTDNKSDRFLISNTSRNVECDLSTKNGNVEERCDNIKDTKENIEISANQQIMEEEKIQQMTQESSNIEMESNGDENNGMQITKQKHVDVDQQQSYETILNAIAATTKSEDSSESLFKNCNEMFDSTQDNIEDNYEPLKEFEDTMHILSQKAIYIQDKEKIETKTEKPTRELAIGEEYSKINNRLKSDFEELSTNMGNFVNQLEREQEERQEVIKVLFCKEIAATESSCETSENENVEIVGKMKLERIIDQWDNETRIKKENIENKLTQMIIKKEQLKDNAAETEIHENLPDKLLNNKIDNIAFEADGSGKSLENTGKVSTGSFEYIPMDVASLTLKSNKALNSLERESKELKKLLKKLENDNEELFKDVNLEEKYQKEDKNCVNQLENEELYLTEKGYDENHFSGENYEILDKNNSELLRETNRDTVYQNTYIKDENLQEKAIQADEEDHKEIVEQILQEILQSFDMIYIQQKSYEFPNNLRDSNNEENDLASLKAVSRSIPEVIISFNNFFNETKINHKTNNKNSLEKPDNQNQKSLTLKELSKQSNLKQINTDTLQSLNEQLEEIRRNQLKKVHGVVDRVYAQKDRYNDSLELVNGKLMVRNQHTKELEDLPQSRQYESSDGEDYDTAHSEDEEPYIKDNLRKEPFRQRGFKPTARKSSEDLIIKALVENKTNSSNVDSDEDNDKFYSLDCQEKLNLYDIDKEFLNKLTFDLSNLTQTDENHIVQCARSYEELKQYLTLNKDDRCLTEQEQKMLDNMIKSKYVKINEKPENLSEYLQNNSDLSKQEQLWLNGLMTLKAPASTSHNTLKQKCHENTCNDKYELENSSEKMSTNKFLRDTLEKNERETYFSAEEPSEEEKNEVENNVDLESAAAGDAKMLHCEDITEIAKNKLKVDEKENILTESTADKINIESSAKPFGNVEILECNLEIIADNDEIVDTITVNAESHY